MSKGKLDIFIQFFINNPNNGYTLSQLAAIFSLSERSIRQYISQINKGGNYNILKNEQGFYSLTYSESFEVVATENTLELSPKQRQRYLINLLLLHKEIDYFTVATDLSISIPTIEKDILKLRSWLKKYEIELIKTNFNLVLKGDESSLRILSSELIRNEIQGSILDLKTIASSFNNVNVERINTIVINCLRNNQLYLNGYVYNSLLLHLAIAVERIRNQQELKHTIIPFNRIKKHEEYSVAINIAQELENEFAIKFNANEVTGIAILISNVTTQTYELGQSDINDYIKTSSLELTEQLISTVEEYYYLPKIDSDFVLKLSIHIDSLIQRAALNQQIDNVLTSSIKQSFPYIFDISVFVANELSKRTGIFITENEITFIALHIGTYFERANKEKSKLKCIVIFPQYYDYHKDFIYKIKQKFSDVFDIVDYLLNINDFSEELITSKSIDIVISTVRLDTFQNYILVSPLLSKFDLDLINDHVYSMQNSNTKLPIKKALECMIPEGLFAKEIYLKDEFEYIYYLGKKLINQNRINQNTLHKIIEREQLSSTSFSNNLAIPHTIEVKGKQSSIAIIVNQKPIIWGLNPVYIIIMLVMKTNQKEEFRHILNYLIEYFSDESRIMRLIKIQSLNEFLDILFDI